MCLVDNPGFGEAKQHVLQLAERSMRCSSAYIYLSETTSLGGTVDARAYRTIADQDRGGRFFPHMCIPLEGATMLKFMSFCSS